MMTLVGFGNRFTAEAFVGLLVIYAVRAMGAAQSVGRIGLLYTATALRGFAASLLLPLLTRRYPVGRITLAELFAHLVVLVGVTPAPASGPASF